MANIVLVDDEQAIREALELILTIEGHDIQAFEDGRTALTHLETITPDAVDLVISDVMMPGMNGLDLLNAIRKNSTHAELPMLFISASVMLEEEGQFEQVPLVSYLRKPFAADDLFALIDTLCP